MPDPTKVLDALQSLVVSSRAAETALRYTGRPDTFDSLRIAVEAAENVIATPHGARVDHLRRVEARGPGPNVTRLGPLQVELVHHELLEPPDRLRVWRDFHLLAEVELHLGADPAATVEARQDGRGFSDMRGPLRADGAQAGGVREPWSGSGRR